MHLIYFVNYIMVPVEKGIKFYGIAILLIVNVNSSSYLNDK